MAPQYKPFLCLHSFANLSSEAVHVSTLLALMAPHLWQRKELWVPTWKGWFALLLLVAGVGGFLFAHAESFLAISAPVPADVLVVEGWISRPAVRDAVLAFETGHYRSIVAVGGWTAQAVTPALGLTYAQHVASRLVQAGCPSNSVLIALPSPQDSDRTSEQARSARRLLSDQHIVPTGINVFTSGPHARRSRLVYRKIFGPNIPVGVICSRAEMPEQVRWWQDSVRGKEVIAETLGWIGEILTRRPPEPRTPLPELEN